ncbi:MAG TPA: hypothetical protein DD490_30680 [Acidobacteria bacterium]|nr:hypothetical protein [Acidobacteriota bacterium]
MNQETEASRRSFAGLLAVACALLTVPRLLLHELWRDEAWLWLVVTESRSVADLFVPLQRSGQGNLFPLLCHLAAQISSSPRAMQLVHLLLVTAAAFVWARRAPFGRRERVLFVLGYFPFYEYAVISRHYAAGMLLAWLACVAARSRRPAPVLGLVLGLLCQTTVYGFLLALALGSGWWLDRRLRRRELDPLPRGEAAAGLALGLAGAAAGLVQLIPAPGTSFAPGWRFGWDAAHAANVLAMPWHAFWPVPRLQRAFWNTNLLDTAPSLLQAGAGVAILILTAALLWPRKAALVAFALGTAGILAFGYVKYVGVLRHQGHLWLLFAAALWLGGGTGFREDRRSWRDRVLLALLIVHAGAGAFAGWMDLRHPFSNGAAAAELIRARGLDRFPLLGHREPPAATVALYLGRPLYSPSRKVFTTHPDWGPEQREMGDPELRCAARGLAQREGRDIVLVINRELPSWAELDPEGCTAGAIQPSEDYHLYRLRVQRLAATAQAAGCGVTPPPGSAAASFSPGR